MAYGKKRSVNARTLHHNNNRRTAKATLAGKTIVLVIVVAVLAVLVALLISFLRNPERVAKSELEDMAKNYYENSFYAKLTDKDVLENYKVSGLPDLTARQLILHDISKPSEVFEKYCDKDTTRVKIFPEEPYGKTDYRIEYKYNCEY